MRQFWDKTDSEINAILRERLPALTRSEQLGCFVDTKRARDLGSHQGIVQSQQDCFLRCRTARLPFAGLQFGMECWCGFAYGEHGQVPAEECNMTCSTTVRAEHCGGASRNLVFDLRPNLAHN